MLNQCNFIGRLGQDPEVRYSQGGTSFASLSVACTEKWKDKQTQEQKERTEWVKAIASGRLAEVCGEYLRKGSLVYISGKMVTSKWQDQSGQDRYTTEIRINEMKMLSSLQESNQGGQQQAPARQQQGGYQQQQSGYQQQQQRQEPQYPNNREPNNSAPQYNEPPMDYDAEIPF